MNAWVLSSTNIPCFWNILGPVLLWGLGLWSDGLELVKKTHPHLCPSPYWDKGRTREDWIPPPTWLPLYCAKALQGGHLLSEELQI